MSIYIKDYLAYLLTIILALPIAILLLLLMSLIPAIIATLFGQNFIYHYLFLLLFLGTIIVRLSYCLLLIPIIILATEKIKALNVIYDKMNITVLSAILLLLLPISVWGLSFSYYFIRATISSQDNWRAQIQAAQFFGQKKQKQISNDLCNYMKEELETKNEDLIVFLSDIDNVAKNAGLTLSTEYIDVKSGRITYYFAPKSQKNLNVVKSKTIRVFKERGFGTTSYWLNVAWYRKGGHGKSSNQLIDIEDAYIKISYRAPAAILRGFNNKGILNIPPSHVLDAAKESGLEFVKSEITTSLNYYYSVPVHFANIFGRYFNVRFKLNSINKGGNWAQTYLDDVYCLWPHNDIKSTRISYPPSKEINFPPKPTIISSCREHAFWLRCQKRSSSKFCKKDKNKKGAPEPICAPPKITFPEEIYGINQ